MAEFDQFGSDYRDRLEKSIGGLGTVDSALASKLQVLERLTEGNTRIREGFVLDFGCGTGLLTGRLNQFSNNTLGADVSLVSLQRREPSDASFFQFDGCNLPVNSNSIDLAVASCVFHHIPPLARPTVLAEIFRVLSPEGLLVIIEHNPFNPVTRFVVNRCEFDEDAELLSLATSRQLAKDAGLSTHRCGYFYAIPPLGKLLGALDRSVSRLPIGAQYFCAMSKPAA